MTDSIKYPSSSGIRTIGRYGGRSSLRDGRPPRSRIGEDPFTPHVSAVPSGIAVADGLILSLYNEPADAQPTDSAHDAGGAKILHAHVELLFWGTAWQTATDPSVTDVVDAVEKLFASPYLLGLAEYGLQDVAVRESTVITTSNPPQHYKYGDVANFVWGLINDGRFPDPDDDGGRILYMVFMPEGTVPPPIPNSDPPAVAVGAHDDPEEDDTPGDVDRAWVGYVSNGTLDHITAVLSHELVETITDPEPSGPAWVMNRKIHNGSEIGDACNGTEDVVDGIAVKAYWSQRHRACVIPKGRGQLPNLLSLEEGVRIESGSTGQVWIALDGITPVDLTVSFSSDHPEVLAVPATFVIPTGDAGALVTLRAEPVTGAYQFITIHASLAGTTVTAQVEVTPRPSIIEGVVRDTSSNPIADATVIVNDGTVVGATTNSDGSYATPALPPGTYKLDVSAYGFVPVETTVVVLEGVPATDTNFTLEVRLPFTVAGTVTTSHHTPIVGADVLLKQQDWEKQLNGVTDSTGGYSLSMNPRDYTGRYWLRVTAPGYAEGFLDLAIPNGANLREDFVLPELGVLTGRVLVNGAAPVAGATVKAAIPTTDPFAQPTISAVSDASGRYLLRLPPGPTAITVHAPGYETYTTTVAVVSGGSVERDFKLVGATAALSCTVSDKHTGSSINDAYVTVGGQFVHGAGVDGRYHVSEIPAGTQLVDITATGYSPHKSNLDFTAGQTSGMDYGLEPDPPPPPVDPHHPPT